MPFAALHPPQVPPQEHEEDIAHSQSRLSDNDQLHINIPHRKGKGKERSRHADPSLSPDTSSENLDKMEYPPANEDAEETRRIEENLRRWEIAERQRRKAARGSTHSSNPSSLIDDVTRRASLLWSGRKSKHPSIGGSHAALHSQEHIDAVPLNQLVVSPTPSPTHSESDVARIDDPFANPPELLSPFSDSFRTDAIVPFSNPPDNNSTKSLDTSDLSHKPTQASRNISRPPLPMPLNLPPPRTPPRIISPLPSPNSRPEEQGKNEAEPVQWWHEWLCGCGEGPDRGGDFQAGQTNPLE